MDRLSPTLIVFVRHLLNNALARLFGAEYPWATPIINITDSLAMGPLVGWLGFRASGAWSQHIRLFAATGVLGGYATFSTFSLETVR
jgi:CrcB protein